MELINLPFKDENLFHTLSDFSSTVNLNFDTTIFFKNLYSSNGTVCNLKVVSKSRRKSTIPLQWRGKLPLVI